MNKLSVVSRPLAGLIPYTRNARTHNDAQVAQIAASIAEFGWTNPVLIDSAGGIIAGHGRVLAAQRLGMAEVPCIELGHLSDEQKRAYIIADNKLPLNAGWDALLLALELGDLADADFDLDLTGFSGAELDALLAGGDQCPEGDDIDGEEEQGQAQGTAGSLADRFLLPPFSVLSARDGWWQDRKRAWIALGIQSEIGRDAKAFNTENNASEQTGVSIFDPVLCELAYRWFCPPGGTVIDPFAGGSVRGLVAAKLGRQYIGCDLRAEQVAANRAQVGILADGDPVPVWHCGDSRNINKVCGDVQADFLFTCPPYADLEIYSDDPADISTLTYSDFREVYTAIIKRACSLLKSGRFACIVVGEVREKNRQGAYRDFIGDTVQAFRDAGLDYYNEAILVTMVGSLPVRVGPQFTASRKLGKSHQNVLVFVKGDYRDAVAACGDVDVADADLPPG